MNTENKIETLENKPGKFNLWLALGLGLIAFLVGIMPFFYMHNVAL